MIGHSENTRWTKSSGDIANGKTLTFSRSVARGERGWWLKGEGSHFGKRGHTFGDSKIS